MKKWEYVIAKSDGRLDDIESFTELGEQGWELVGVATFSGGSGLGAFGERAAFYFKREKTNEAETD